MIGKHTQPRKHGRFDLLVNRTTRLHLIDELVKDTGASAMASERVDDGLVILLRNGKGPVLAKVLVPTDIDPNPITDHIARCLGL